MRGRNLGSIDCLVCAAIRNKGSVLDHKRYADTFREALAKAEISDWVRPFHDGRHSAITHEAASGSASAAVQARAAHADFMYDPRGAR